MVEKPLPARKLPISAHVYANTETSPAKDMARMSSNSTLQSHAEDSVREDLVLVQCPSISTSFGERESSNPEPSTACFGSERGHVTHERQEEGEMICEKDDSERIEWRIKKLSEEIRQLKIENDRLKLEQNSVLSEQNKPKHHQNCTAKTDQWPVAEQLEQLSKGHVRTKCNSSAAVRIWTQDQINRLTKLLIATKQIINKYAKEHRRLEESNKKLLRSNRFLTQSNSSLERQNLILNQESIEKDHRIGKLQSRNMLLCSREKDCKKRLRRLEEKLTGWAMSVLSSETNRKGECDDQTSSTQMEGEKDEEIFHDSDIPGLLPETECNGEDPTPRSNSTRESEDEKTSYSNIPKVPASSLNSKMSDPNIRHLSSDFHRQKCEQKKSPHVQHKFPRPIDRYPKIECPQNDFRKFNGQLRSKKRKCKKKGRSAKRPPIGSELAGAGKNKQSELAHQHAYCSVESESNITLAQSAVLQRYENPNQRN